MHIGQTTCPACGWHVFEAHCHPRLSRCYWRRCARCTALYDIRTGAWHHSERSEAA